MSSEPVSPSPRGERFILLDGLRGIAALFIVQRHATELLGDELPSSYLGVDLFFGLSGFVLAHAYGKALLGGKISPLGFMQARLFRLYPLYGLALVLMVSYFATLWLLGLPTPLDDLHRPIMPQELALATLTGLLFIPSPFRLTLNGALFLVHPAWSLFNELVANLVFGLWGVRATARQIRLVIAFSAVLLVVAAIEFGRLHAGFRWNEMYAGMARVFFSFFVGVMIYRHRSARLWSKPYIGVLCLVFVALVLTFPTPKPWRPYFDLLIVFAGWPALLFVACRCTSGPMVRWVSAFLGTASYAVYVMHVPLLAWTIFLVPQIANRRLMPYAGLVFIALLTVLCWLLTVWIDQPLQRWFKHRSGRLRPSAAE
jgi:peptidoglycan/LPS O-acetylase OafA/YrhL